MTTSAGSRRKIMHLITDLDIGGTELMLLRLLPELQRQFEISVCCVMGRGPTGEALAARGIPVDYLDLRHRLDFGVIARFYRVVRARRPSVLVTHLIHPDIFGRLFGRLFGIKRIVCSQQGSLLQWEYLRYLDRLTAGLVDRYVVQTETAKRELINKLGVPPQKFITIPNSVLPFALRIDKVLYRERLGLPVDQIIIVCVSRLRRRKGHEYLLRAFETVHQEYPATTLLLVGDGEREAALRAQIEAYTSKASIVWLGNRQDINEILAVSDIFVLPSEAEGMSNALLEAMAAGLPCIASNIEVNQHLITPDKNGLMFVVSDTQDLTRRIRQLLSSQQLRQQLGQQAQQDVRQQFDPASIGQQWATLLTDLP